ncbi:MAG: TIGR04282 family arsenosugar biosynthesis glycosyltransferase [Nitrospinota bacterium]
MRESTRCVLVVMAKAPRPGEVKTRLVPPLLPDDAAELHKCCLVDTLEKASRLRGVVPALAYAPAQAEAEFESLWPPKILRFPQEGADLGERMRRCLERAFAEGFGAAGLYGTDIPHADGEELERGFGLLREGSADLVLGPTEDGGYYFLGARASHPDLFRGVRWSAPGVLEATLERAAALGLRTAFIARERDLDTPEDLKALRERLSRAALSVAPRTRKFLRERLEGIL